MDKPLEMATFAERCSNFNHTFERMLDSLDRSFPDTQALKDLRSKFVAGKDADRTLPMKKFQAEVVIPYRQEIAARDPEVMSGRRTQNKLLRDLGQIWEAASEPSRVALGKYVDKLVSIAAVESAAAGTADE